ncbi:MAG: DNA-directed RNA polymerase subunit beta'' [Alphaproteobacteria bacterium]|nr:DNA-directed RNA polymerase subunit beta'' [Alphaproteobacteria bacterium]
MKDNSILFNNNIIDKKKLKEIIAWAFSNFGSVKTAHLIEKFKNLGFKYATQSGFSISIEDLTVPPSKDSLIKIADIKVFQTELKANQGKITENERFQQILNTWANTSEKLKDAVVDFFNKTDPFNPVYIMAFSGARGNISQVRQLVGMRGLMSDPNGQIIAFPIKKNFREGLTLTDYIISTYGARKGLVDTALRTADSGYLTRRLIDVAQDIIIREKDCGSKSGILITNNTNNKNSKSLWINQIFGRVTARKIINPQTKKCIIFPNKLITKDLTKKITQNNIKQIILRSPLTCLSRRSICQYCYGWNLASELMINLGEAVGIIAAQSIGEPGTQLTMRTFHTGGVFTSENIRQFFAKDSGQIKFSKDIKTNFYRTEYGECILICENESSINLYNYKNKVSIIKVYPKTKIFVQNETFVKQQDLILEYNFQSQEKNEENSITNVYVKESGEIKNQTLFLSNDKNKNLTNNLVWVLSGHVYTIPLNSSLINKSSSIFKQSQNFAHTKLVNKIGGIFNLSHLSDNNTFKNFYIFYNHFVLDKNQIYLIKNVKKISKKFKCTYFLHNEYKIHLQIPKLEQPVNQKFKKIGILVQRKYKVKTGGIFSNPTKFYQKKRNNSQPSKIGGSILYIPQYIYPANCDFNELTVKKGQQINGKTKLYKNTYTNASGLIDYILIGNLIQKILVKPGLFIQVKEIKKIKQYNNQIFYPGEIILNKIQIKRLCYSEIKNINKKILLCFYPIIRYEITEKSLKYNLFSKNTTIKIEKINLNCISNNRLSKNQPFYLVQQSLYIKNQNSGNNLLNKISLIPKYKIEKQKHLNLRLNSLEQLIIQKYQFNNRIFNKTKFLINILQKQYVEPYSQLANYGILTESPINILKIKEQYNQNERKVLFLSDNNFKNLYLENKQIGFKKRNFIISQEPFTNAFISKKSGLIDKISGNQISLRFGTPYLFSQFAVIKKYKGDLIKKGELLGQIYYKSLKTADIVQGLPKVEEILEARRTKSRTTLIRKPGIIRKIKSLKNNIQVFVSDKDTFHVYYLSKSQRLLVKESEFVTVGQSLVDTTTNYHNILYIFFIYYKNLNFLNLYQSAYRSLRKIQSLIIKGIQSVYWSQGVNIANKHVEIIVKQMTSKVKIIDAGSSAFLPEELIDLEYVNYINKCLKKKNYIKFEPILLGITRASLKTNSFISAASFQYTTNILAEAAIRGKIDWLRGLKENIIVGRLIPSGTGFNLHSDISYIATRIPMDKQKNNLFIQNKRQKKYNRMRNRIKFFKKT